MLRQAAPTLASLTSLGLSAHLHARSSAHPEQRLTVPGAPSNPEQGKRWKQSVRTMPVDTSEPALASQQDEVVQRTYTLYQKNGTLASTTIKAMMANGNATSLCSQLQLSKFRQQTMYCRVDQKPPQVVSHMGL